MISYVPIRWGQDHRDLLDVMAFNVREEDTRYRDVMRRITDSWVHAPQLSDLDIIAAIMSRYPWSPISWRDGIRRQDNYQGALTLALDFDYGNMWEMIDELGQEGYRYIVGTTRRHKPDAHRFRVLFFLDGAADLAAYQASCQYYARLWKADMQCCDGARFYWPCTEIVRVKHFGGKIALRTPETPKDSHNSAGRYIVTREASQAPVEMAECPAFSSGVKKLRDTISPLTAWQLRQDIAPGNRHGTVYRWGRDFGEVDVIFDDAIDALQRTPTWQHADDAKRKDLYRAFREGFVKQRALVGVSSGGKKGRLGTLDADDFS